MKNKISCVIHTKNEEKNIEACINSVKKYVDEIVVIDMESNDQTVSIAVKLGAKVYIHKDVGFADPARNYGVDKAKYVWVLSLDADERVRPTLGRKIVSIVMEDKYDLVKIPHKNIMLGKWIKHTGWWPDYHYRLYKKGSLINIGKIHTPPKIIGKVLTLPAKEKYAIAHNGHNNVNKILSKYIFYSDLDNSFKEYIKDKNKIIPEDLFEYVEEEFKWRYISKKGYKDKIHGFMLSKLREYYRFIVIAKYWEKSGYNDIVSSKGLYDYIEEANRLKKFKNTFLYKIWRMFDS